MNSGADPVNIVDRADFGVCGLDADQGFQAVVMREDLFQIIQIGFAGGSDFQRGVADTGFACHPHGFVGGRGIEYLILVFLRVIRSQTSDCKGICGGPGRDKKDISGSRVEKSGDGTPRFFDQPSHRFTGRVGRGRVSP